MITCQIKEKVFFDCHIIKMNVDQVIVIPWFVRLYGETILGVKREDYLPYRWTHRAITIPVQLDTPWYNYSRTIGHTVV